MVITEIYTSCITKGCTGARMNTTLRFFYLIKNEIPLSVTPGEPVCAALGGGTSFRAGAFHG